MVRELCITVQSYLIFCLWRDNFETSEVKMKTGLQLLSKSCFVPFYERSWPFLTVFINEKSKNKTKIDEPVETVI